MAAPAKDEAPSVKLFLCGDVMLGRGIDQILPQPVSPALHEPHVRSAATYVRLAEEANGPIPRPAALDYVWGDALAELARARPDLRVINLETAVTRSEDYEQKGINYRMSPENARCLKAAGIDCCVLANNHALDWGRAGLAETLDTLHRLAIKTAGAGRNASEARAPAAFEVPGKARVLVYAFAATTSGVPERWAAGAGTPGLNVISALSDASAEAIADTIAREKKPGDLVVASIHWGANWGYAVPRAERRFARRLIEEAGVSIVYGHSAHHPKAIETHRGRLILYGCGDFLNDYEGIGGYETFRGDLALMYLASLDCAQGALVDLELVPFQIRRFQLVRATGADARWLCETLGRVCAPFGTRLNATEDGRMRLALAAA